LEYSLPESRRVPYYYRISAIEKFIFSAKTENQREYIKHPESE